MTVALANTPPTAVPVDAQYLAFETGFLLPLVSAQTITATGTTAAFALPYIAVAGKARLVVNISAISGTSAGLATNLFETVDGTNYNSTAVLTIASQTATGTYWSSAASGPIYNQAQLSFTVVGTTPSITFSAWLVAWNR